MDSLSESFSCGKYGCDIGGSIVTTGVVLGNVVGFGDVIGPSDVVGRDVELSEPVLLRLVLTGVV